MAAVQCLEVFMLCIMPRKSLQYVFHRKLCWLISAQVRVAESGGTWRFGHCWDVSSFVELWGSKVPFLVKDASLDVSAGSHVPKCPVVWPKGKKENTWSCSTLNPFLLLFLLGVIFLNIFPIIPFKWHNDMICFGHGFLHFCKKKEDKKRNLKTKILSDEGPWGEKKNQMGVCGLIFFPEKSINVVVRTFFLKTEWMWKPTASLMKTPQR